MGKFSPQNLFGFESLKTGNKKNQEASVAWRKYLPLPADVHEYGCRIAAVMNANRIDRGLTLIPLSNRRHYLGYYDLSLSEITSTQTTHYFCNVIHHEENGEIAHCCLFIILKEDTPENTPIKTERAQIISLLWEKLVGPERHVCNCDAEYYAAITQIELPAQPPLAALPISTAISLES